MSIAFSCAQCGKKYTVPDETAGKAARYKQCGHRMTIPRPGAAGPSAEDIYGLADPDPEPAPRAQAPPRPPRGTPPQRFATLSGAAPASTSASDGSEAAGKTLKGVLSAVLVLAGIGARVYFRMNRADRPASAPSSFQASQIPGVPSAPAVDLNGPIVIPALPDVGPGRELEPGVTFHEVRLPGGSQPGFSGKLWLYLPSGAHAPRSLPCVLITGAGSNLLVGMDLGDGDRPEHLPYVRAGFAVLAYELDGAVPDLRNASEAQVLAAARKFLAARAGLVNAHIALEFLLRKVPQVDPQKVYTAGHSSAGTAALLVAAHEPAVRGCVAYAPAIDLMKRFGPLAVRQFQQIGLGDLAQRYSPRNNESTLNCPVMLFHARDDSNVSVAESEGCAGRLKALGKSVTLEIVPTGNHYDSMIEEGIPRGIAWLQGLAGTSPALAERSPTPAERPSAPAGPPPAPDPNASPDLAPDGLPPPPNSAPAASGFPPPLNRAPPGASDPTADPGPARAPGLPGRRPIRRPRLTPR